MIREIFLIRKKKIIIEENGPDYDDKQYYDDNRNHNYITNNYESSSQGKHSKNGKNIKYNVKLDVPYKDYTEEQEELLYKFPKLTNKSKIASESTDNNNDYKVSNAINRTKRKTRKRHEKDIYSFNDTSNIFDKLFKKKDNY